MMTPEQRVLRAWVAAYVSRPRRAGEAMTAPMQQAHKAGEPQVLMPAKVAAERKNVHALCGSRMHSHAYIDPCAADTPDVRLTASSVEPIGRHRANPRLDRLSLPIRLPGQHAHPLPRRPPVDPVRGGASGA